MGVKMLDNLRKQVSFFEGLLKQRGFFYDINQLDNFFQYSYWITPAIARKYWDKFIESRQNEMLINEIDSYIHMPYCRSKCAYCMYPSWPIKGKQQLNRYIDYLRDNMLFFKQTFSNVIFRNLYIGGGTPTILNNRQIRRLMSDFFRCFSFRDDSQKTIECNPDSVNKTMFFLLRDFGFNRISFGVQSLNPTVLKINKRNYQTHKNVKESISLAKKAGFRDINVDLLIGLAGDSIDYFSRSFSQVARLRPCNIVVYGLMPQDRYLTKFLRMNRQEYYTTYYPAIINKALKVVEHLSFKFGYIPDSLDPSRFCWGFRHKDCNVNYAYSTYSGERSNCIFGLGVFSRSRAFGLFEYRHLKHSSRFNPDEEIYSARKLSLKEEMMKFIINQIHRKSRISLDHFHNVFNSRLIDSFPYAIYALKRLNKIKITDKYIRFLFATPEERYIHTLFFVKDL